MPPIPRDPSFSFGKHTNFDGIRYGCVEDLHEVAANGWRLIAELFDLRLDRFLDLRGLWFQALLDGLYPGFHSIQACRTTVPSVFAVVASGFERSAFLLAVRLAGVATFTSAAGSCLTGADSAGAAANGLSSFSNPGEGITKGSPPLHIPGSSPERVLGADIRLPALAECSPVKRSVAARIADFALSTEHLPMAGVRPVPGLLLELSF